MSVVVHARVCRLGIPQPPFSRKQVLESEDPLLDRMHIPNGLSLSVGQQFYVYNLPLLPCVLLGHLYRQHVSN